jgi:hypothetical protein
MAMLFRYLKVFQHVAEPASAVNAPAVFSIGLDERARKMLKDRIV